MKTCRETAQSLSSGEFDEQGFSERMALVIHLAMCRHCRAFAKQTRRLRMAARLASARLASAVPQRFEDRIVSRLAL